MKNSTIRVNLPVRTFLALCSPCVRTAAVFTAAFPGVRGGCFASSPFAALLVLARSSPVSGRSNAFRTSRSAPAATTRCDAAPPDKDMPHYSSTLYACNRPHVRGHSLVPRRRRTPSPVSAPLPEILVKSSRGRQSRTDHGLSAAAPDQPSSTVKGAIKSRSTLPRAPYARAPELDLSFPEDRPHPDGCPVSSCAILTRALSDLRWTSSQENRILGNTLHPKEAA